MWTKTSLAVLSACHLLAVAAPAFANRVYDPQQAFALRDQIEDTWEFQRGIGAGQVHAIARASRVSDTLDSAVVRISCHLRTDLSSEPGIEIFFWERGYAFLTQRLARNILGGGWTASTTQGQNFGQITFAIGDESFDPAIPPRPQSGDTEGMNQYISAAREALRFLALDGPLHVSFDWHGSRTVPLNFSFPSEGKIAALTELARYCPFPQ